MTETRSSKAEISHLTPRSELERIAESVQQSAPQAELELACLAHLCRTYLARLSETRGLRVDNLVALGDRCAQTYLIAHGLSVSAWLAALDALAQADETYAVLRSIPG